MTFESYFISLKRRFIRISLMDNITSYCYQNSPIKSKLQEYKFKFSMAVASSLETLVFENKEVGITKDIRSYARSFC